MPVTPKIRDASSGFPHDHDPACHVPGAEFDLPKSIETACRDIAKIERSAAGAPHPLGLKRKAREVIEVVVGGVADVLRKPGYREGGVKLCGV